MHCLTWVHKHENHTELLHLKSRNWIDPIHLAVQFTQNGKSNVKCERRLTSDAVSVLSLLGPGDAANLVLMMSGLVTSVFATVVGMVTDPSCSSDTEISIFTALSLTVFSWSPFSWLMFSLLPFSVPICGPGKIKCRCSTTDEPKMPWS